MSLFGALNTAISGLDSQSAAFSNISDNVANSQTVGFKRTDTSFEDYLSSSSATRNDSGSAVARPDYMNTIQGTIATSDSPLSLAITGQGFFPVSQATSTNAASASAPSFSPQPYFTRAGDFSLNKNGYVVNSSGSYLNGWAVNATTGAVNRNALAPIHVSQSVFDPVQTSSVTLSANLPATPAADTVKTPLTSQVSVYDSLGTAHTINLNWQQVSNGNWAVTFDTGADYKDSAAGNATTPTSGKSDQTGSVQVKFGGFVNPTDPTAAPDGTISNITGPVSFTPVTTTTPETIAPVATTDPNVTTPPTSALNGPAGFSFVTDFGNGPQTIDVNLGTFGGSAGVTQFAGTDYTLHGISQNGVPPGSYSSVTTTSAGDVVVNYDNGENRTIARVPIVTFNDPDALQKQDGQNYTSTTASGTPSTQDAGTNGAGGLVVSSVEQSNVDIASEFSKLIVAQQAYTANTKVVTTANDMLQQTIDMKR